MPAEEIMRKFHAGMLKSGSGHPVTSLAQAKAIAASYGSKEHSKMPTSEDRRKKREEKSKRQTQFRAKEAISRRESKTRGNLNFNLRKQLEIMER